MGYGDGKCNDCGRFMTLSGGASTACMYDFVAMELSHKHYRCARCTAKLGPIDSNARPADGDMSPYQSIHQ
jgi:hypothetical protein